MSETLATPPPSLPARLIRYWLPIAGMMTLMFLLSTDLFSGDHTRQMIALLFRWLGKELYDTDLGEANYAARKFMHFFEYAVLAALLFRAFRGGSRIRWRHSWGLASFATVALWSLLDEFHQTFTHTRGGSIYDSLLDSSGGLFALLLIACLSRLKRRNAPPIS